jgi:hypothetical protein
MANMKLELKLPPAKTGFGQQCNGHTQASAQAAPPAFVCMYCGVMIMVGNMLAMPALTLL